MSILEHDDIFNGINLNKDFINMIDSFFSDKSYSKIEYVISLYIKLCNSLTYEKEAFIDEISLDNTFVNRSMFINILEYFLRRKNINYIFNDKGIIIEDGEYRVLLLNSEQIISNDITKLVKVNGIVPISDLNISNQKLEEKMELLLDTIKTEKLELVEAKEAMEKYHEYYINDNMAFSDRLKVFLSLICENRITGKSSIPYFKNMYNVIFQNGDISLGFIFDHSIQDKKYDNTPLIVLYIWNTEQYFVINTHEFSWSAVKAFKKDQYYDYISESYIEVIEEPKLEKGEEYVRETKNESQQILKRI